jgi:hypothetical protein
MRLLAVLFLACFLTSPAVAFDSISLSEPLADPAPDTCPALTRINYPWLDCRTHASGGTTITTHTVAANASWATDRRIPYGHPFVEGHGYRYWGDVTR